MRAFVDTTRTERTSAWTEFRPHPTMFWRLRAGLDVDISMRDQEFHVTTDSRGLRGPEFPLATPPSGWRAWCLGDSITYGYGVDDEDTYEARLQGILRAEHPSRKVEVLNGGCPGWSSFQAIELTKSLGDSFRPDLYILAFVYADPAFEDVADADRVDANPLVRWAKLGLNRSELYMYLRQRVMRRTNPRGLTPVDYRLATPRIPLEDYERNLAWFTDRARRSGGHVIFMNLAKRDPDPHEAYATYREVARKAMESTGNAWIDVDALFREQPDPPALFSDRIHPNAQGFALMAEALARTLDEKGWLR